MYINVVFFARRKITNACLFFCLFSCGQSYRISGPRRLIEGLFDRKSWVLVPFPRHQKYWRPGIPSPTPFYLKFVRSKFEIVIFLAKFKNLIIVFSRMIWPPTAPGWKAERYELCPLFTYCIGYWEVCRYFSGGISCGRGAFSTGIIFWKEGSFWDEPTTGKYTRGKLITKNNSPWKSFPSEKLPSPCFFPWKKKGHFRHK